MHLSKKIFNVDERILRSFVNYALGRMTYVSSIAQEAVENNVHIISDLELARLRSLIFYCDNLGQKDIDDITWKQTQHILEAEIYRRIKNKISISERSNKIAISESVFGLSIRGGLKSIGDDYKYLIRECIDNVDKFSTNSIRLILKDIDCREIYGTKKEHVSSWLALSDFLKEKYNKETTSLLQRTN